MTQRRAHRRALLAAATFWLAIVGAGAACAHTHGPGFLHRSHTNIVDGDDRPIVFRGLNLGNWLIIEPWMTHLPGNMYTGQDGDNDDMRAEVEAVVGAGEADEFFTAWRDNYVTEADIRQIRSWGFNSVRVPMDFRLFYDPRTGADVDTGFHYLDRLLRWCAKSRIYAIPDMHTEPGGKDESKPGNIYSDPAKQDVLARIWTRIAARYANDPWIGAWDMVNEPVCGDKTHTDAGMLYKKIGQAIRTVDRNHILIVEGDIWAVNLDMVGIGSPTAPLWDDNIVYESHPYGFQLHFTPDATGHYSPWSLPGNRLIAERLDVPLWIGETGLNSNWWLNAVTTMCEKPDVLNVDGVRVDAPFGWCMWAYKAEAIWCPEAVRVPADMQPIKDYWESRAKESSPTLAPSLNGREFNAPKPSESQAFAALMEFARSTNVKACTVNRDVVDALTRTDFATHPLPYAAGLSIPGHIDAVNYDMGPEGLAYHDTVSDDEAEKGPLMRVWNDGEVYRNDGVDIFPEADGPQGYIVGDIDPGEWTTYTVDCKPGVYELRLRYSAPTAGGCVHVLINNVDVTGPVDLPVTGDLHTYQTITLPRVSVSARGKAMLKLSFETGGYNIDWLEFGAGVGQMAKGVGGGLGHPPHY